MKKMTWSKTFEKDVKRMAKRGKDGEKLSIILTLLENEKTIPSKYQDHPLVGNWKGYKELHIEPDWLLIYKNLVDEIILTRTGTHSDIF